MKRTALIFLGWLVLSCAAYAASFDCAKASTKIEKIICGTPAISKLDDELGKVYQDDISKANEEQKQRLVAEQKHWLKYTRNVCTKEPCFKHAYWSRLAELETFFEPKSPLYKKESDKAEAEAIRQVLASAPLYYSAGTDRASNEFCNQMFDDLKQMNGIRFVDPIVQTQSYEDPALDSWKQQCRRKEPLHFSYICDGRIAVLYEKDIPEHMKNVSAQCAANYGLPPFKLFELPPLQLSGEKYYVFYSEDDYGPMNQDWKTPQLGAVYRSRFQQIDPEKCERVGASAYGDGDRHEKNYNSIIEYKNQYYFFVLNKNISSWWLDIHTVAPYRSKEMKGCRWSPVAPKPIPSTQGSK